MTLDESNKPPLIDAEHAEFLQGGVSMSIGSCGRDLRPSVARAAGCRIAPDRRSVRLMVSRSQAAQVLAHVVDTGRIAVAFNHPPTHRTLQLKGLDATIEAATEEDLATVLRYRDAFIAETGCIGFARELIGALLDCPLDDIAALTFTPTSGFSQTPGPDAGQPLRVQG